MNAPMVPNASRGAQTTAAGDGPIELLTPDEVASILRITKGTLANWRSEYEHYYLPYIYVGRLVRYRRSDVMAMVNKQLPPKSAPVRNAR